MQMLRRTAGKWIGMFGALLLFSSAAPGQHRFDHIPYRKTPVEGEKKGNRPIKGSVVFDKGKKTIEFLSDKGDSVLVVPMDQIKDLILDYKTPVNPLQVVPDQYLLTIRYKDNEGTEQFIDITLNTNNCREFLKITAAETAKEIFHKCACCVF